MSAPADERTALITGASSGIGEALAHCFARDGHRLVLVARAPTAAGAGARCESRTRHRRRRAARPTWRSPAARPLLATTLRRKRRRIDVLVNNAGVLAQGAFTALAAADHQRLIDLNVSGADGDAVGLRARHAQRGFGRVLNVASIAAFQPVPGLATYAATKAYVLSLTESLAEELRGSGVTVTALCPGITDTGMLGRRRQANPPAGPAAGLRGRRRRGGGRGRLPRLPGKGEVIVVPGALNRAATLAGRATPKWLLRRISGAVVRGMKR
jgi:short-subunit dehydrogenase